MRKLILTMIILSLSYGCSSMEFKATSKKLDLERFMGDWFVQSGRVTFLEQGAHNPLEIYSYNKTKNRIDIDFKYNKDSLDGKIKKVPQKGYVENSPINTHWKVSPIWPLKFDYLVLDFANDYSWCAIGVPSGRYLWIMTRLQNPPANITDAAMKSLKAQKYPINDLETFKHNK